ncbi:MULTISPECIES: hypothetical protein [unclassified Streptomyces]|uniref:hypothetical protein n=1 Tax=unclassified Streptomyces TaxID=2593676 RepID=UPI003648218B
MHRRRDPDHRRHDLYGDPETYGWEREAKHHRQDRYIGRLDFSGGAEDSGGRATT